jgi:hypothetical protein
LVDDRLSLTDFAGGRVQHQIALGIHFKAVGALEGEDDPVGVGARAHNEVVLQLTLVAVIDEIDAGVEVVVPHLGIRGHIGAPLGGVVADEVVGLAGQFFQLHHARVGVSSQNDHSERRPRRVSRFFELCSRVWCFTFPRVFRLGENQDRLRGSEKECVRGTAGEELDLGIGLSGVATMHRAWNTCPFRRGNNRRSRLAAESDHHTPAPNIVPRALCLF